MEYPALDAAIGENLATLRQQADLSQADLAKAMTRAGWTWHQQTVLKVEKGHRPLRLAEALALADALDVDPVLLWAPNANVDELGPFRTALHRIERARIDLQEVTEEYEKARDMLWMLCDPAPDEDPARHVPEPVREEVRVALAREPADIARDVSERAREEFTPNLAAAPEAAVVAWQRENHPTGH